MVPTEQIQHQAETQLDRIERKLDAVLLLLASEDEPSKDLDGNPNAPQREEGQPL